MSLQDDLVAAGSAFPAPLEPQKDGSLAMEMLIAERKAFLSKRKLTYKCKLRADDGARCVTFWEMLVEKSSGVSGGDDMAPGFGFKKETFGTKGMERSGSIEEASRLFGKDFDYTWDYAVVRDAVRGVAEAAGYNFNVVLNPKSV
ncbi:MAG: ribonucleoside-triphosphate reductase [Actinobacteria bacterium]|nr:ribonucleoside-triphosphate reductase [Actinomycetota bacterium]